MKRTSALVLFLVAGAMLWSTPPAAAQANFSGVGDLPGGRIFSAARGVSPDGSVVVGVSDSGRSQSGDEAFRWTHGALTGLGGVPCPEPDPLPHSLCDEPPGDGFLPEFMQSSAEGASVDGSVIVGGSGFAVRWEGDELTPLCRERSGATSFRGVAFGASADGSVVVGDCLRAFRWTESEGIRFLGVLPVPGARRAFSTAYDVSADGSVIVGVSTSVIDDFVNVAEAFRWEIRDGCDPEGPANPCMVGLGDLPGGESVSVAYGVSADGRVVVGEGRSEAGVEAFRWEDGVMVGLGQLPCPPGLCEGEFNISSVARAVSADGSVVVGQSSLPFFPVEAFIWREGEGMQSLQDFLAREFALDLAGWRLTAATGISDDGRTIVGEGFNPDGQPEGWIAVLPLSIEIDVRPGSPVSVIAPVGRGVIPVAILGSDAFDVADVDVTTLSFGPERASPTFERRRGPVDLNHDGLADLVFHFRTAESGIASGDAEACLSGATRNGTPFLGCDAILTRPGPPFRARRRP